MQIRSLSGIIDRRILANYHIDPDVVSKYLPYPFRPKLVNGFAIGGVCLIRLKNVRPSVSPISWGINSENAAHRIGIQWYSGEQIQEGVFIPRRDTNSRLSVIAGGAIFPGNYHHADFKVQESQNKYSVDLKSDDGLTEVHFTGNSTESMPKTTVFSSLKEASNFFQSGLLGYSVSKKANRFDILELNCKDWLISPLKVESIRSSFFENEIVFPKEAVEFDCALLMRNIYHEWIGRGELNVANNAVA